MRLDNELEKMFGENRGCGGSYRGRVVRQVLAACGSQLAGGLEEGKSLPASLEEYEAGVQGA